MKPEFKNLILLTYGDQEMWGTSKDRNPNGIYNPIKNEEIRNDTTVIVDSSTRSVRVPLLKETTKVPVLMMSKISNGHKVFIKDYTKTWASILEKWNNKKPEERLVIQMYTLTGRDSAIVEITSMHEMPYAGRPIRISLKLIVWL